MPRHSVGFDTVRKWVLAPPDGYFGVIVVSDKLALRPPAIA
jgi:hypothetical protein